MKIRDFCCMFWSFLLYFPVFVEEKVLLCSIGIGMFNGEVVIKVVACYFFHVMLLFHCPKHTSEIWNITSVDNVNTIWSILSAWLRVAVVTMLAILWRWKTSIISFICRAFKYGASTNTWLSRLCLTGFEVCKSGLRVCNYWVLTFVW